LTQIENTEYLSQLKTSSTENTSPLGGFRESLRILAPVLDEICTETQFWLLELVRQKYSIQYPQLIEHLENYIVERRINVEKRFFIQDPLQAKIDKEDDNSITFDALLVLITSKPNFPLVDTLRYIGQGKNISLYTHLPKLYQLLEDLQDNTLPMKRIRSVLGMTAAIQLQQEEVLRNTGAASSRDQTPPASCTFDLRSTVPVPIIVRPKHRKRWVPQKGYNQPLDPIPKAGTLPDAETVGFPGLYTWQ